MGIWKPATQPEFSTLTLSRGDFPIWGYTLQGKEISTFPTGSYGWVEFRNSYDQVIDTWYGFVDSGVLTLEPSEEYESIPRGATWTLTVEDSQGRPRQLKWGLVTRNEPLYPDAPPQSSEFDGVQYGYSWGTPGRVHDPAWRILKGHPTVHDNSARSLPNGVSAGGVLFDQVAMLYYAPLRTDSVRLTYNTIRPTNNSNGEAWVIICSDYSATNWAGFRHKQVWGGSNWNPDTIEVITGTSPTTFVTRATINQSTANNQAYTAEYSQVTNKFSLYLGDSLDPLISWEDATNVVDHGEGERHVGFGFQSAALRAGVMISDWIIGDLP